MAKEFNIERGPGIADLVRELRETPDRLDKEMRKEFRKAATTIRDDARSRAQHSRPQPKTPVHKGDYHWRQVVNAVTAGSDSDAPTLRLNTTFIGWEVGSTGRYPQFGPRTAQLGVGSAGRFFFPAIREGIEDLQPVIERIVTEFGERLEKV